jgi:hypothetical protein
MNPSEAIVIIKTMTNLSAILLFLKAAQVNHIVDRKVNHVPNQTAENQAAENQAADLIADRLANHIVNLTANRSANRSANHTVNHTVNH